MVIRGVTVNETSFNCQTGVSTHVVFGLWGGMDGVMELLYFQILARSLIKWWTGAYRHHPVHQQLSHPYRYTVSFGNHNNPLKGSLRGS